MFTVHILATSPQFVTNEEVNFPLSLFLTHNHGQLFPLQIITDQNTVFSPTILLNHSTYTLQYYQIIHSIYKIIPSISFTCNTYILFTNFIIHYISNTRSIVVTVIADTPFRFIFAIFVAKMARGKIQ